MVLILTDYFKVSISTTRLLNGNSVAGRNPAPPVIYKNLMNNDIYIYSPLSTGVFFRIFFHQPPSSTSIGRFSPPHFRGAPSVLHRRPRSRDGPWKAQSPACGERFGVSIYLWDPVGHLKLKVHTIHIIYIYIHSNIHIHIWSCKIRCLYVAYRHICDNTIEVVCINAVLPKHWKQLIPWSLISRSISKIVVIYSWWFQSLWKICDCQIGSSFPRDPGENNKCLSCHHLVMVDYNPYITG